ncbi:hypothetical protein IJI76_01725 [Candidatus Saccharibacteria bacterium]|jgi:hypothetical protein|nr:hypothetical protein [Candidatus Saccharibacteria bacterium]
MKKIVKNISQILTGTGAAICLWTGKALTVYAEEEKTAVEKGAEAARATGMPSELIGDNGVFGRITNVILLIVGIISVVMLIYGGLRYILSGGDSKKVTDAKNTILYAIIGLIISLLAYAIVNFVLTSVVGVNYIQQ